MLLHIHSSIAQLSELNKTFTIKSNIIQLWDWEHQLKNSSDMIIC